MDFSLVKIKVLMIVKTEIPLFKLDTKLSKLL